MDKKLTWREAIEKVLNKSTQSLHYVEITNRIISDNLLDSYGATPVNTVSATITSAIRTEAENCPFIRVAPGVYWLKTKINEIQPTSFQAESDEDDSEQKYKIITSYGMYWRRDAIEWKSDPQILGMMRKESQSVDFSKQIGIYLLYDGREVIYVGRTDKKRLGKRLSDHTTDRLATRWDRFSWFCLLQIDENVNLKNLPDTYNSEEMCPAFEAILIEALEPRQNRQQGEGLSAVEYLQYIDPEIENRRLRVAILNRINR